MPVTTVTGERSALYSPQEIFLIAGAMTVPVFFYIVILIPQASIRFLVWLLSHTVYRVRVFGRENLPREGGALLVPNHVSWVDGILLMLTSSRPIRMVAWATNLENAPCVARTCSAIPIDPTKLKLVVMVGAPPAKFERWRAGLHLRRRASRERPGPGLRRDDENRTHRGPGDSCHLEGMWGASSASKAKFF
jgi:hypothetical protein